MWNGHNLKMYIQPPCDKIDSKMFEAYDEVSQSIFKQMYEAKTLRSEPLTMAYGNSVRTELRQQIIDKFDIKLTEKQLALFAT